MKGIETKALPGLIFLILSWMLHSGFARAADSDHSLSKFSMREQAPPELTLREALHRAYQNNPEILQAEATAREGRFAVKESKSLYLPKISALGQYTVSDDPRTNLPDANQAVVRVDEEFFNGGRMLSDVKRLRSLESSSLAELDQKRLEIQLVVENAYFQGIADQEQIRQSGRAKAEFSSVLRLIEPKAAVGSVSEYDYARIRVALAQYERDRIKAEAGLHHQLWLLGESMGGAPPQSLAAVPDVTPPPEISSRELMAMIDSRPSLQAERFALAAADSAVTKAKRERFPVLRAGADYGYAGQTVSDVTLGWGFDASLSVPIFDFGEISARISQAEARRVAEEAKVEALRLRIRTETYDLLQTLKSTWADYVTVRDSLPHARRAYTSALRRYRTGIGSMPELSDSHDLLVQTRASLELAKANYRTALGRLEAFKAWVGGGKR